MMTVLGGTNESAAINTGAAFFIYAGFILNDIHSFAESSMGASLPRWQRTAPSFALLCVLGSVGAAFL